MKFSIFPTLLVAIHASLSCRAFSVSRLSLTGASTSNTASSGRWQFASHLLRWASSSPTTEESSNNQMFHAAALKESLLVALTELRQLKERDGDFAVDFGVRGGELNATSRAPNSLNYYSISPDVGRAADRVLAICNQLALAAEANTKEVLEPTAYLGDVNNGDLSPLEGPWKLLFSNAADATFSKNTTRGTARVQNIVNAKKGRIINVIDFDKREDGTEPALKQLSVVIKATAEGPKRVALEFKYAKAVLTRLFFLPLFGRQLSIYIPIPGTFITRLIALFGRLFRRRGNAFKVPKAYFDVLYLDNDLRVHKTGDDNIFVQAKETWKAAQPLIK